MESKRATCQKKFLSINDFMNLDQEDIEQFFKAHRKISDYNLEIALDNIMEDIKAIIHTNVTLDELENKIDQNLQLLRAASAGEAYREIALKQEIPSEDNEDLSEDNEGKQENKICKCGHEKINHYLQVGRCTHFDDKRCSCDSFRSPEIEHPGTTCKTCGYSCEFHAKGFANVCKNFEGKEL